MIQTFLKTLTAEVRTMKTMLLYLDIHMPLQQNPKCTHNDGANYHT